MDLPTFLEIGPLMQVLVVSVFAVFTPVAMYGGEWLAEAYPNRPIMVLAISASVPVLAGASVMIFFRYIIYWL